MNYIARTITTGMHLPNVPTVNNIRLSNNERRDYIMNLITEHFGISKETLVSKTRKREILYPRQIVAYLLKLTTTLTYFEIATFLGGKEHSNAVHSCQTIKDLMDSDEKIKEEVEYLRNKI